MAQGGEAARPKAAMVEQVQGIANGFGGGIDVAGYNAGDEHRVDVGDDNRYNSGDEHRYNAGDEHDTSGTKAKHTQSPLPVAGLIAASTAVTGLAAGTASPAAAFGMFALLLASLSLVILHVRRA